MWLTQHFFPLQWPGTQLRSNEDVCARVRELYQVLWEAGMVHGDAAGRNVVVSQQGSGFPAAVLVDLGRSLRHASAQQISEEQHEVQGMLAGLSAE